MSELKIEFDEAVLKSLEPANKMLKDKALNLESYLQKHLKKYPEQRVLEWRGRSFEFNSAYHDFSLRSMAMPSYKYLAQLDGYKALHQKCRELNIKITALYDGIEFDLNSPYRLSADAKIFAPDNTAAGVKKSSALKPDV